MDETYGTYVDDECFDIHDYDDDTDGDTDDDANDDTDDDADDDADDVGRGNRRLVPGGAVHFPTPGPPPKVSTACQRFETFQDFETVSRFRKWAGWPRFG